MDGRKWIFKEKVVDVAAGLTRAITHDTAQFKQLHFAHCTSSKLERMELSVYLEAFNRTGSRAAQHSIHSKHNNFDMSLNYASLSV